MRFHLSEELQQALRQHGRQLQSEVEDEHDVFLLYPGMGPMIYITADGRMLCDGRDWAGMGICEGTDDEAIGALVCAAHDTGIAALLELIPRQPEDGSLCPMCNGSRWAAIPGIQEQGICMLCHGRGWVVQAMLDKAASTGFWPPHAT